MPGGRFRGHPLWWNEENLPAGADWERGHLIAAELGGPGGRHYENMVPQHLGANRTAGVTGMRGFEREAAARARRGECIAAAVVPIYFGNNYFPTHMIIQAMGDRGYSFNEVIVNGPVYERLP